MQLRSFAHECQAFLDHDLDPGVRRLLRWFRTESGMESALLRLADPAEAQLHQVVAAMDSQPAAEIVLQEGAIFPWSASGCRLLRAAGRNFSPDMHRDFPDFHLGRTIGLRAYLSAPIEVGAERRFYGTLCGIHPSPMGLPSETIAVARVVATVIGARLPREQTTGRAWFVSDL